MSTALQVALFSESIAVVLLVMVVIPILLLLYRHAKKITNQLEELNSDLKGLIQDSRMLVKTLNHFVNRTGEHLDEINKIIRVIRTWSEQGNHIIEEIGAIMENSLLKVARSIKTIRQIWSFIMGASVTSKPEAGQSGHQVQGKN